MSKEIDILMGRAAIGELDAPDAARLEELCEKSPALREEADALRCVAAGLSGLVKHAEAAEEADAPTAVPAALLSKLEAARKEVFQISEVAEIVERRRPAVVEDSLWKKFSDWVGEITSIPIPALASAAALFVAVVGVGWWMSRDGGGGNLPLAMISKDPAFSADVSILSPGDETSITDPTLLWLTVNPEVAQASVSSADGKTTLFRSGENLFKAEWSGLEKLGEIDALQAGETYLVRVGQGDVVSERLVKIAEDARPLSALLVDPDAAKVQIGDWLKGGQAGDALSLATALAAKYPEMAPDLTELRRQARDAAMAAWVEQAPES